jgi:hypothetical protein
VLRANVGTFASSPAVPSSPWRLLAEIHERLDRSRSWPAVVAGGLRQRRRVGQADGRGSMASDFRSEGASAYATLKPLGSIDSFAPTINASGRDP